MLLLPLVVIMRVVINVVVCTVVVVVGYKASGVGTTVAVSIAVGRGGAGFFVNCIVVGVHVLARSVTRFVVTGVTVN